MLPGNRACHIIQIKVWAVRIAETFPDQPPRSEKEKNIIPFILTLHTQFLVMTIIIIIIIMVKVKLSLYIIN
jgi:hypothetical protein